MIANENFPPDSNIVALLTKNFDFLPPSIKNIWYNTFNKVNGNELKFPERVIVELSNTCNLDCPMCRVGQYGLNFERVMPLKFFKQLSSYFFPKVEQVRINGLGEATIIPEFLKYIEILKNFECYYEIITNLTSSIKIYEELLKIGVTMLISWDAATPLLYERLRRPAKFSDQFHRLAKLTKIADGLNKLDNLILIFTLQAINFKELPKLVDFCCSVGIKNLLVNIIKQSDYDWLNKNSEEIVEFFELSQEKSHNNGIELFLPDHLARKKVTLNGAIQSSAIYCDRPWKEIVIRFNGDISVCNMFNPYIYGNLYLHKFDRIWNGRFAQTFRKLINTKHFRHPYCLDCYYLRGVYEKRISRNSHY